MKKSIFFACFASFSLGFAQIPTNYYNGTANLEGEALQSKLTSIISSGYQTKSYDNLYNGYKTTHSDNYTTNGYENDGTVLDIYSENPNGKDPYNYRHGQKKCGNYSIEGDCYNREHIIPQSIFNKKSPMVSDIHHVIPSDGKVNGFRSNYPFGKVSPVYGEYDQKTKNGTLIGSSISPGYGGKVAEPINEFKGDVARMVFYFATRYKNQLNGFDSNNILTKGTNFGIQAWQLNTLLLWHIQDPISQVEIDRNNASYEYQNNRNPYIDNPEFVTKVFGKTTLSVDDNNFSKTYKISPNPVKSGSVIFVDGKDLKKHDKAWIFNMAGQRVQEINQPFKNGNSIKINNLPKGIYILKTDHLNTKFIVE